MPCFVDVMFINSTFPPGFRFHPRQSNRSFWPAMLLFAVAIAACRPATAADLDRRPCGPDSLTGPLRLLVPQGFAGADFRPACRRHDGCYDTPGSSKAACDRGFYEDMRSACSQSRFPRLCRCVAKAVYGVASRRGDEAFVSAQRIARAGMLARRRSAK